MRATTQQRNSNIELLRCILMVQILFYHLLVHGTKGIFFKIFDWQPLPLTRLETVFLILCMYPVDCFVIISGYYGITIIKDGKIRFSRLLKTYVPLFFYSVLFATIAFCTNKIGVKEYGYNFLPVLQANYWFASCYIILVFFSPVLNAVFEFFYKKKSFILAFIVLGFANYFLTNGKFSELMGMGANRFYMLVYCYFVGRFLNAYEDNLCLLKNQKIVLLLLFFSFVAEYGLIVFLQILFGKNYWVHLSLNSSPLTILQAILVFSLFRNFHPYSNKIINQMGAASFAIYLITENSYVRRPLYTLINGEGNKDTVFLIPYLIFCAVVVSAVCISIDLIRSKTVFIFCKLCQRKLKND